MLASVPIAHAFDFGVHVLPVHSFPTTMSFDGQVVASGLTLYTQAGASPIVRSGYYTPPRVNSLNDDGTIFGGTFQGTGVGNVGTIDRGPGDFSQVGESFQETLITVDAIAGDGSAGLVNVQTRNYHFSRAVLGDGTPVEDIFAPGGEMYGFDLSRNGQFAVGYSSTSEGGNVAYRQRVGVGFDVLAYPGASGNRAICISADGSVVAGSADYARAFLWSDGVYTDLPYDQALYRGSFVGEMNDDATVLVGSLGLLGVTPSRSVAAVWIESQGWVVAQDYFASFGIVMPQGRTIEYLTEVSSDGMTFLGSFDNDQSFVVTVPGPGALALLAGGVMFASRRRR
jgi:probable HAF family extracellular repeat protein